MSTNTHKWLSGSKDGRKSTDIKITSRLVASHWKASACGVASSRLFSTTTKASNDQAPIALSHSIGRHRWCYILPWCFRNQPLHRTISVPSSSRISWSWESPNYSESLVNSVIFMCYSILDRGKLRPDIGNTRSDEKWYQLQECTHHLNNEILCCAPICQ